MNDRLFISNRSHFLGLFIGILLFLFTSMEASCQEPGEVPLLDQALATVGLDRKEISIRPDLSDSVHALSLFKRWIKSPLDAPPEAQSLAKEILASAPHPHFFLNALTVPADIAPPPLPTGNLRSDFLLPDGLPKELVQGILILLDAVQGAEEILAPLMTSVSPDESRLLEKYFYPEAASKAIGEKEPEGLPKTREIKKALRILERIDRREILKAALLLTQALEKTVAIFARVGSWEGKVDPVSFVTPVGRVTIGGTGPDTHREEAALIIDLGGDDAYNGAIASGRDGRCALVLDLDGDDHYLGQDFTQGAGFRGIGILWDLKGDDLYRAGRCSQGAGLFGVGLLMDSKGSDRYLGESFVQAASLWGWGGLIDLEGEDSYQCSHAGQAHAGTLGVSCLTDVEGNDKYLSGARAPDRREPGMNQSFSQGFAVGMRDTVAGGFALLADGSGNDHYQCGYFGQGSSSWMAVGILYDERGKDTYSARRYSQGAGIHFSLGLLLDVEGNDHTHTWGVSQGCGHDYGIGILLNESGDDTYVSGWLCMGASEANGIGLFLDNAGDDGYDNPQGMAVGRLIQKRRAGGPGIFVDAGGRDRYSGPGEDNSVWGANRWSIGMDGNQVPPIGVHLSPPEGPPPLNRTAAKEKQKEIDRLSKLLRRAEALPQPAKTENLLTAASHWGHERDLPKKAGERLLALDAEITVPIVAGFLDTPDIMTLIYMQTFFSVHASTALPLLIKKAQDSNPRISARALSYLGALRDTRALTACIKGLDHDSWKIRSSAAAAVGDILDKNRLKGLLPLKDILDKARKTPDPAPLKDYLREKQNPLKALSVLTRSASLGYATYEQFSYRPEKYKKTQWLNDFSHVLFEHLDETVDLMERWIRDIRESEKIAPQILALLDDPDPAVRKAAAYSLAQLEVTAALPHLISALKDPVPSVRDAAVLALARFGKAALDPLTCAMGTETSAFKILALDLFGRIKSKESEKIIETYLKDSHPGVRRAAGQAMGNERERE